MCVLLASSYGLNEGLCWMKTLPGTAWSSISATCDARLRPQSTDQPHWPPAHPPEAPACTRAALTLHPLCCLAGAWQGLGAACAGALPPAPDLGPTRVNPHVGVCTIGAAPLVVNFNIPVAVRPCSLLRTYHNRTRPGPKECSTPGKRTACAMRQYCWGVLLGALPYLGSPARAVHRAREREPQLPRCAMMQGGCAQGISLAAARRVARAVSARGGGLPAVEAMALPHGDGARL